MNCQEVQLQLSGYLEKSLDAIRMKGVETHLAACPFCRVEARGLSDCISFVGDLPLVEPPPGFAQRVLVHAREIELEPRLWQRLLAVLQSTAPIQATAVLLVGVLAVLVYQKEPQLKNRNIADLPAPPKATVVDEPDANAGVDISEKQAIDSTAKRTAAASRNRSQVAAPRAAAPAPAQSKFDAPATDSKSVPQWVDDRRPDRLSEIATAAPRRPPIQAQEVSTGREPARPNADAFGIGGATGIGALSRQLFGNAPFAAGRAPSPLSEPSADFEFIVRRRVLERREAAEGAGTESPRKRSEADAAIASAAAHRAVPAPAAPSSSIVEIRWFTVAPHHLEHFRKELGAEANIESEKAPPAAEKEFAAKAPHDPLLIKVIILPSER